MKSTLMLGTAALAVVLIQAGVASGESTQTQAQAPAAQGPAAISGQISSAAEGPMEGVVVTAHQKDSIVSISVSTDAQGDYSFPENRLEPGHYDLAIRAVGYDMSAPS